MWFLKGKDNSCFYMPLTNKCYVIGKSNKAFLKLTHEKTDYNHARILIAETTKTDIKTLLDYENQTELTCSIIDTNSSTGTFLMRNGDVKKLNSVESCKLTAGDRLKFGKDPDEYEVKFEKTVVFVPEKYSDTKEVNDNLQKLGIKVYNKLNSQCTHYVHLVKYPSQTFAAALAQKLCITGPEFWKDCVKAYNNGSAWPNVVDYGVKTELSRPTSTIKESITVDYNLDRSKLFEGLTFIFFSTQDADNHGRLVRSAGGNVELYCKLLFEDRTLGPKLLLVKNHAKDWLPKNGSVIDKESYNLIKSMMNSMNRRMIRRAEIVAAVLKNSTSAYCNQFIALDPKLDHKQLDDVATVNVKPKLSNVSEVIVIDDSDDEDFAEATPQKKKFKIKIKKARTSSTVKREVLDNKSTIPVKKQKTSENLMEKWLSAKPEKQSTLVTKADCKKELKTPPENSSEKSPSLKELVALSQKIKNQAEAIEKLKAKFKFNPFQPIQDDTPDSSSSLFKSFKNKSNY